MGADHLGRSFCVEVCILVNCKLDCCVMVDIYKYIVISGG